MTEYEILFTGHEEFSFNPQNEAEDILQNVIAIVSTPKFSVPLFREFGISQELLDAPINEARAKLISEIIRAVRKYEPRAEIKAVKILAGHDGRLNVRLKVGVL